MQAACAADAAHRARPPPAFALPTMSAPDPLPRTPFLLRSAVWRVGVALALSALLIALWRWALQGGGA